LNVELDVVSAVLLYDVDDLTSLMHVAAADAAVGRLARGLLTETRFTSDVSIDSASPWSDLDLLSPAWRAVPGPELDVLYLEVPDARLVVVAMVSLPAAPLDVLLLLLLLVVVFCRADDRGS